MSSSQSNKAVVNVVVPEADFTLFNATRSGKAEVVVVNGALLAFQHLDVFPWHLCVTLEAKDLVDNGMPSPAESETLFRIGDMIEELVLQSRKQHNAPNALFIARSNWDGQRELLFQVHDPEIAHQALQELLASRTWERTWHYRMQEDPEWSNAGYAFTLFPQAQGHDA